MKTRLPLPWDQLDGAVDHVAEVIKDALLDGFAFEEELVDPSAPPADVDVETFVAVMRGDMEAALRQVAAAVAVSPDAAEEQARVLFGRLCRQALLTAVAMRQVPPPHGDALAAPPEGRWARLFREMHDEA